MRKSICRLMPWAVIALVPLASAHGETLSLRPAGDWALPLSDGEMGELRGGFAGVAFSAFFTGSFDSNGAAQGNLVTSNPPGGTAPPPNSTLTSDGQVKISTVVGNFQGANGIFQIAQVPGSFNVVNNNLFVQVAVINIANTVNMPNMAGLFGPPLR